MNCTILFASVAAAAFLPVAPAAAQTTDPAAQPVTTDAATTPAPPSNKPVPGNAEAAHHDQHDEGAIIVTGIKRETADVLGGVSVLNETELTHEVRPSLGETLARQPGVSSSSFGPTASTPVLRGLTGERVRVLTDGIGSFDLSTVGSGSRGRDQPADGRADRGAARAGGVAVRVERDRRRGQRDRSAHPAAPAGRRNRR